MYKDPFGKEHRYGPPANWVQPAYESFNAAEDWKRLCVQGLQFKPYSGPSQLRGIRGDCLEPLLVAGRHMIHVRPFAADEAIEDGGLYCIEWNEATAGLLPAYKERFGIAPSEKITIAKFLRFIACSWHSQCKDSIAELDGTVVSKVVGVIALPAAATRTSPALEVHARQPLCGNPFDPESAECGQVGPNAATLTFLATNNFSGLAASGTTGQHNTNISFLIGSPPNFDCTVIVTVVVAVHQSAGAGTIKIMIGYDDTGGTSYTWSVPEVQVSGTSAVYTLQYQYTHSAANTGAPRVVLGWDSSSAANSLTADGYETFQSEYIVR